MASRQSYELCIKTQVNLSKRTTWIRSLDYPRVRNSYSGVTSMPNTRIGILGYLHRVENYCQDMRIGISMQSPHRIVLLTILSAEREPDVLEIFLHHQELPLDEMNSDPNLVLFTINSLSPSGIGRSTCHSLVRWDVFGQRLKLIEFPSDHFLSTDELETAMEAFTNTLRSAKIAGPGHVRP